MFNFALRGPNPKAVNSELAADDIIIATLGSIGTGKSNFIDTLVGGYDVRPVYNPLASAALTSPNWTSSVNLREGKIQHVRICNHRIYGDRLVFLDTPGYDDTNLEESDVLGLIKTYLKKNSPGDSVLLLSGIISFHRISDNRCAKRQQNLGLFSGLCVGGGLKRMVFVTTMWDSAKDDARRATFEQRLEAYKRHWDSPLRAGAMQAPFNNTSESAWTIVLTVLSQSRNIVPFPRSDSPSIKHHNHIHSPIGNDEFNCSSSTFPTPTLPFIRANPIPISTPMAKQDVERVDHELLPVMSPVSPISASINRALPISSFTAEAQCQPEPTEPTPQVRATTHRVYDHPKPNHPKIKIPALNLNRPLLSVDLGPIPNSWPGVSTGTGRSGLMARENYNYACSPCPLSPNTSDMWLLADRVYASPFVLS